jgi:putative membrane protein
MMSTSHVPPLDWHTFLTTWHAQVGWLVVCAALLVGYAAGLRAAARRDGVPVGPWRILSFVLGVVGLAVCLCSAVNAYAMALFWMHMIEHLTLIMLVPALLVLGSPLTVVRASGDDHWRARFDGFMHSPVASVATHPFVGMTVYAVVIFYTHLTPFMDHMAHQPALMTSEQVAYVAAGWLMLLPLIGQEPIRWQTPYLLRLALLVVAMIPDTFVGIILLQTEKDPFPAYMAMRPSWATSSVHDLQIGGALMWSAGDGLMMCLCIGLVISLIAGGTRDQVLGDWLESVRTNTFEDHVARTGGQLTTGRRATIDDDDALAAYNAMLGRLSRSVSGTEGHEDDSG